jgi:hypothetical protein
LPIGAVKPAASADLVIGWSDSTVPSWSRAVRLLRVKPALATARATLLDRTGCRVME